MTLTLDHVFMLVGPGAEEANVLLEHGFVEGTGNVHLGQGTANRRFYFANGMLEFLWVHDADEARGGPGHDLHLADRAADPTASPFGVILIPQDGESSEEPFPGWHYQPDYFPPPKGFHVGANSHNLAEPLCFYFSVAPSAAPKRQPTPCNPQRISDVVISTPSTDTEGILAAMSQVDRLNLRSGQAHLLEITLDSHALGRTEDYRPAMPLILRW